MSESEVRVVNHYEDEISLRDLYLIIKSGFWWIIGISLLSAVITFIFFTVKPDVFEAQSTSVITPSSISIANDIGVSFTPQTNVSFETYKTLANSQSVFNAIITDAYEAGYSESEISFKTLIDNASLKQLFGPSSNRPETASQISLSVDHIVKNKNAELAAFLANRWVEHTLVTVKNALFNALNPVSNVTEKQLEARAQEVDKAENDLRNFNVEKNIDLLEKQFTLLNENVVIQENQLNGLASQMRIQEVSNDFLKGQFKEAKLTMDSDILQNGQAFQEIQVQNMISNFTPGIIGNLSTSILKSYTTANIENELRAGLLKTEQLTIEHELLSNQLETDKDVLGTLQEERADLLRVSEQLNLDVQNARAAYQEVIGLEPTISYISDLLPSSAQVLNKASVPTLTAGMGDFLPSVLAFFIAGFLTLLFVFLREAIKIT